MGFDITVKGEKKKRYSWGSQESHHQLCLLFYTGSLEVRMKGVLPPSTLSRPGPTHLHLGQREVAPTPRREETQGQGCLLPPPPKAGCIGVRPPGDIRGCRSAPGTFPRRSGAVRHQRARWVSECWPGRQRCGGWAS